ncbi:dihydroxyacetone kinase phosphoryl donor subunit DhaM [Vaginisenegalia massiliensis]|uniref:dihydroxyacetone kinase phosphoryl donor subunit DhaM n=1 Tax=Vaginisenegalia massiliensis TaxID=2058294 RepID=UPI000F52D62B|nr:dihydroxyacetone kinase phosphoryl donor subunit DhaM [Vaginisenegalia massiliensis]
MTGIILVSHCKLITDGIKLMVDEMVGDCDNVKVISAGGTDDGRLGTNGVKILEAILSLKDCTNILIFCDIGSSILSSEMAIELVDDNSITQKVKIVDAPLVEGAFAATVQASVSSDIDLIVHEAQNV